MPAAIKQNLINQETRFLIICSVLFFRHKIFTKMDCSRMRFPLSEISIPFSLPRFPRKVFHLRFQLSRKWSYISFLLALNFTFLPCLYAFLHCKVEALPPILEQIISTSNLLFHVPHPVNLSKFTFIVSHQTFLQDNSWQWGFFSRSQWSVFFQSLRQCHTVGNHGDGFGEAIQKLLRQQQKRLTCIYSEVIHQHE